ncbi:MAG: LysM domain-containing protein [Desulfobacteraceae bacterium]|jgi:LysM repeat protein
MRRPNRKIKFRWQWIALLVFFLGPATSVLGSSLVYKNYIVRYDRGWDILCEPYVVQKNDWVLKIFRQKGEIAHKDFRDFLGIFKRLNPHIKNIDMIRPGQSIDIPLRKLEHGTLPGQATGVVTIPFVTLTEVTEVIKQHSNRYTVRRGDTVSQLLARKYGRYGSKSYQEGIKLFKAANPQISNLDLIYAGQKLYLPDPTIREKEWYATMYDAQGNLRKTVDQGSKAAAAQDRSAPIPQTRIIRAQEPEPPKGALAEAAAFTGAQLKAKGTYFLPRQGNPDFELDLSKHPLMEFDGGPKLVFTPGNKIMEMDKDAFHANWPDIKAVSVDENASTEQYVAAIFDALDEDSKSTEEITFERQGVHVAVRAKWVRLESEGRRLCITPISAPDQRTPESIRRYLEQNGIVIKEILPGGSPVHWDDNLARHAIKNVLALTPANQKDFVRLLAKTLGFTFAPNTGITFPYAGIQVEAYANLLSTKAGQEVLVDFGDLYGDAVKAINNTGLKVIQITAEDNYDAIAQKLFSALSLNFKQHPTLLAAQRPATYNTAITIYGLLYAAVDNQQILFTSATLHSAVTDMLSDRGIDVVVW